jgi:hypothetical protein
MVTVRGGLALGDVGSGTFVMAAPRFAQLLAEARLVEN